MLNGSDFSLRTLYPDGYLRLVLFGCIYAELETVSLRREGGGVGGGCAVKSQSVLEFCLLKLVAGGSTLSSLLQLFLVRVNESADWTLKG